MSQIKGDANNQDDIKAISDDSFVSSSELSFTQENRSERSIRLVIDNKDTTNIVD